MDKKTLVIGVLVGAVIVLVCGVLFLRPAPVPEKSLGGTTAYDMLKLNGITNGYVPISIAAGTSTMVVKNLDKTTMFYDLAEVTTSGTASSSFKFWVVASSTQPRASEFYTNPTPALNKILLGGVLLATSSAATTTNSILAVTATGGTLGSAGNGVVAVPAGQFLVVELFNSTLNLTPDPTCSASGACEGATSTSRGFNIGGLLHFTSTTSADVGADILIVNPTH